MWAAQPLRSIDTMIIDFFVSTFYGITVNDVWFQQDGANCHISHGTIDLLRQTFDGRFITKMSSHVIWLQRSCNLTPLNYILRRAVKENCPDSHINEILFNF